MVTFTCRPCGSDFEANKPKRGRSPETCPTCKKAKSKSKEYDPFYWTPEAVEARRLAKQEAHAKAMAKDAEKRVQTERWEAEQKMEYRPKLFDNEDEELAYLVKQQETDDKYGNRLQFRTRDGKKELVLISEFGSDLEPAEDHLDRVLLRMVG